MHPIGGGETVGTLDQTERLQIVLALGLERRAGGRRGDEMRDRLVEIR